MTQTPAADVDTRPPTQWLFLELLAARYRTGETYWTFPNSCLRTARVLEDAGLIWTRSGPQYGFFEARLTPAGQTACLWPGYRAPIVLSPDQATIVLTILAAVLGGQDAWQDLLDPNGWHEAGNLAELLRLVPQPAGETR